MRPKPISPQNAPFKLRRGSAKYGLGAAISSTRVRQNNNSPETLNYVPLLTRPGGLAPIHVIRAGPSRSGPAGRPSARTLGPWTRRGCGPPGRTQQQFMISGPDCQAWTTDHSGGCTVLTHAGAGATVGRLSYSVTTEDAGPAAEPGMGCRGGGPYGPYGLQ